MNLKSYLNLYEILENDTTSREENRAFGLAQVLLKNKPIEQLLTWKEQFVETLKKPTLADRLTSYIYGLTLTLVLVAFFLGLFSGVGLLSYSGHEPVNVIYFMAMVILLPLFTMILTFFSMFRANSMHALLVHISPAFWMEKIFSYLPKETQVNPQALKINPLLLNWIIIKRSQLIALFFSFGLLLALLAMVVTKDIAFAWSTTLDVTPEAFHSVLNALAFPWREFVPSAVPSLELIEQSQYFRLGDKLSEEMISNASQLGLWWKFLAMATIFYALILRFFMFVLASFGLRRAIDKSLLTLVGASRVLSQMNEPIISTHALQDEERYIPTKESYKNIVYTLDTSYDMVQGWAISQDKLKVLSDSVGVITPRFFEVGGANSLKEDNEIISKSKGEVLFFVKGWEPPTMDFVDYLSTLSGKVDKVIVVPIGTSDYNYTIKQSAVDVWDRKLSQCSQDNSKEKIGENIWLKR